MTGCRPDGARNRAESDADLALIRRCVAFCPATGKMTWLARDADTFPNPTTSVMCSPRLVGKPAFACLNSRGYLVGAFNRRQYRAHRVLWALVHDRWPNIIDHINGIKNDNRISNLREVTVLENSRNTTILSNNRSGFAGVYFSRHNNRWGATIMVNRKRTHLGWFLAKEDAVAARRKAEIEAGHVVRPRQLFEPCGDCNDNGFRARFSCTTCGDTGLVEVEPRPLDDTPFARMMREQFRIVREQRAASRMEDAA